jgi:ADP-heptose:LPS heptosyltransferase
MPIVKKINRDALLVTSFAGFGDVLYLTPLLHMMATTYAGVDVWTRNPEPLLNNPDVRNLYRMNSFLAPEPWDFYFQDVYYASPSRNLMLKQFPQSNIHTVDFFSVCVSHMALRDHEKDLVLRWTDKDTEKALSICHKHGLIPNNQLDANIVTITPGITWPSRTLPLEWYKALIKRIIASGDKVVLIGKDINYRNYDPKAEDGIEEFSKFHITECEKQLYDPEEFPGTVCLYNEFSLHELAAFYSLAKVAINAENGNMVVSATNNNCWNIYVPTLTPPEFRVPYRKGSMQYKTVVVYNEENYYPAANYAGVDSQDLLAAPIKIPPPEKVFQAYKLACKGFKNGRTRVVNVERHDILL